MLAMGRDGLPRSTYGRYKSEELYHRGFPAVVSKATTEMLLDWFPTLPPSYTLAGLYIPDLTFDDAVNMLMSQVQEATTIPKRHP
jgi:hypothetical protein